MLRKILKIELNKKLIFMFVMCIMLLLILDTSVIKLYDLSSKFDVQISTKKIIFSLNVSEMFELIFVNFKINFYKEESIK